MAIGISIALIIQMFTLLNPLTTFPYMIGAQKRKFNLYSIANKATLTALIIALIIAALGPLLFSFFGISVDSFKIAGGIVLLLLSIETVKGSKSDKDYQTIDSYISLLATPLLTGPATISFIMVKSLEISRIQFLVNIVFAFALVWLTLFIMARSITKINQKIINISSRILGLILAAIAIEMISSGITSII
jgi:multiple antibiotic resistance protein